MRNAPGKTANNSRSTGSSLVLGLIKITAHESDSWVLGAVPLSAMYCLDEYVLPLRNILDTSPQKYNRKKETVAIFDIQKTRDALGKILADTIILHTFESR